MLIASKYRRDLKRLQTALWIFLALFFASAPAFAEEASFNSPAPKYVILFIGDGLALPQRGAAEHYLAAASGADRPGKVRLAMNSLPVQGINTTYSLNSIITDSGAAGTALACGVKTYNGAIGVDGSRQAVKNLAEQAKEQGRKVGIVSSVSLDHATPASFYAHQPTRNNYYEISLELAKSGFDYFAGGGLKDPEGKRSKAPGEKRDAFEVIKEAGYKVLQGKDELAKAKPGDGKILAVSPLLDADKAMPYAIDASAGEPSLADYTQKGFELLDNPQGFFMMVEGGKIDWACHANDAMASISDTLAFDKAVAAGLEFAAKHPDTLIIVTGDHETGGLTLGFAGTRYGNYYEYLKNQKMSFLKFSGLVKEYKKSHSPENAKFEDMAPLIVDAFGLRVPGPADLEEMKKQAKPDEDRTSPPNPYGMYLKDYELTQVKQAFERSMKSPDNAKSENEPEYLNYGDYEPLTITLTHILDNKAGIGWTTYSHTGMPVATSAKGPGQELFNGYYDNTDISERLKRIMQSKVTAAIN